jgi:hypothetical protein
MSKLLDKFNEDYKDLYKRSDTDRNPTDQPYYTDDFTLPRRLYDLTPASEEQLDPNSISVKRDEIRMRNFQKSFIGQRFTDRQSELQQGNTWAQTRAYRKDNVSDHVDPDTHKVRHGNDLSIQTVRRKLNLKVQDGKVQAETADFLTTSFGPVEKRLKGPGGMLNENSVAANVSENIRGSITRRLNEFLRGPVNNRITGARARYTDTTVSDRPEIEYDYLRKIYEANKAVATEFRNFSFGHIYFPQDSSGANDITYQSNFGDARGFRGYRNLDVTSGELAGFSATRELNQLLERAGRSIRTSVTGGISSALNSVSEGKWSTSTSDLISSYVADSILPRANDISIIRNLKRVSGDIDSVIDGVKDFKKSITGQDEVSFEHTDLRTIYKASDDKSKATNLIKGGMQTREKYISDINNYKNSGKRMSVGSGVEDLRLMIPVPGTTDSDSIETLNRGGNYKDMIQQNEVSILKDDIDQKYDVDSVNVMFEAKQGESVRFRSYLSNFKETVVPQYNENSYIGRIESFYTYNKVVRDATFSLQLIALSKYELNHIWKKINYISSLAYPADVNGGYIKPTIFNITIGKIYYNQPCLITNITHTIDDDTSWDIIRQAPRHVSSDISVRLLDKKLYTHDNIRVGKHAMYPVNQLTDEDLDRGILDIRHQLGSIENFSVGEGRFSSIINDNISPGSNVSDVFTTNT